MCALNSAFVCVCVGDCLRFESKVLLEFSGKYCFGAACNATAPCATTRGQRLRVAHLFLARRWHGMGNRGIGLRV